MELSQIRYFIVAAQFQNLSKAAKILNITQPALSKSISKLEDEIGIRLFDRSSKKITLNESGKKFLDFSINSVQGLDEAVAAVKDQNPSPALYLGLFHYSERLMRCLIDFSSMESNVSFHIERLGLDSHNIDTNRFDMLLYPQNPLFHKYKGDVLYSDPYVLAAHRSNPLSSMNAVHLHDISTQQIIFIKHGEKVFELPYHLITSTDVHSGGSIFTTSYEIQRWLISNNCGVGFIPEGYSGAYADDQKIMLLPVIADGLSQTIMIGFKRQKHLSAIGRHFAAFVREYFGI